MRIWATRFGRDRGKNIKSRGMFEGTAWATRLKRGKEREDLREVYEGTEWATRLRKSGKKKM